MVNDIKIAILGWGSLIWNPKSLSYNKTFGWQMDGPLLPIEFSRISNDGRLTLVITEEGEKVNALYAFSNCNNLDEAILDLTLREGTIKRRIGFYNKITDEVFPKDFKYTSDIKSWISNKEIDVVIWTNLGEKWKTKNDKVIASDFRVDYLKKLKGYSAVIAEEYIRKTPKQIKTKFRKIIEDELKWYPIKLY